MKTAKQREQDFRKELQELCDKHGAEIEADDDGKPYGLASAIIRVSMASIYENNEYVAEFVEFQLGNIYNTFQTINSKQQESENEHNEQ